MYTLEEMMRIDISAFSCETVLDISLSARSPLPPVLVLALLVRDLCVAPRGLGASLLGPTTLAAGCPSQLPEGNLLQNCKGKREKERIIENRRE